MFEPDERRLLLQTDEHGGRVHSFVAFAKGESTGLQAASSLLDLSRKVLRRLEKMAHFEFILAFVKVLEQAADHPKHSLAVSLSKRLELVHVLGRWLYLRVTTITHGGDAGERVLFEVLVLAPKVDRVRRELFLLFSLWLH